jgi:hypothetical protein
MGTQTQTHKKSEKQNHKGSREKDGKKQGQKIVMADAAQ